MIPFYIYNAIYEELLANEEELGIATTFETGNDDVEFYKEVEFSINLWRALTLEHYPLIKRTYFAIKVQNLNIRW